MIRIADWVIDADDRCYIVGKLKTRKVKTKDGTELFEDYIANPRYYTTLKNACDGILEAENRNIIRDGEMTLTEAIYRIEQKKAELDEFFGEC